MCAIATEDVLGGICSPSETTTMHKVVSNGVPCMNVWEAPDRILHFLNRLSGTTAPPTTPKRESDFIPIGFEPHTSKASQFSSRGEGLRP